QTLREAFEPVGVLAQPLLRPLALRDVEAHADQARDLAARPGHHGPVTEEVPYLAVGADHALLERERLAGFERPSHRRLDAPAILRVHVAEVALVGDRRFARHAVYAIQLVRPLHAAALDVELPAAEMRESLRFR